MAPNQQDIDAAASRLSAHAGLSKDAAQALVSAALDAAADQTLDMITGSGPLPSNMTASRAHQLHFVCRRAKRMLGRREVEVLFRATSAQARSIITTMNATYEEALRDQLRAQMVEDAEVSESGREGDLTWTVKFTEPSSFDFASDELTRLGLARWAALGRLSIILPRSVSSGKTQRDPLGELGLSHPAP